MPIQTVDQFRTALHSKKIASLYLFDGPETWLKERDIEELIQILTPPESRDFNLEKFDGTQVSAGSVVASSQSLPFLSERRLIIVQNADEFSSAESEILADSLPHLPSSTCLILIQSSKANLREVIPAAANSHGAIVTYWTPFPNQLPMWVEKEVKKRGKSIEREAAQVLGESCSDLQEISNELDKLILFIGKKSLITWVDVMAHGLPDLSGDQRSFEAALLTKDLKEALKQSQLMEETGIRPEMLFSTAERIFRNLILAFFLRDEKNESLEEIEQTLRLRGTTQKNLYRTALRSYRREEVDGALEKIIDADYQIKTGALQGEIAVTLLLLGLLQKQTVSR